MDRLHAVQKEWKTLLPGETVSSDIELQWRSDCNLLVCAKALIPAGTVLLRCHGWPLASRDDPAVLLTLLEHTQHAAEQPAPQQLLHRLQHLWPSSLEQAPDVRRQSFAADADAHEQIRHSLPPAHPLRAADLMLLQLQLDQNTFAGGIYPLASVFNHSCRPNCCAHVLPAETNPYSNGTVMSTIEVRSVVDVGPGTELCISYLDLPQMLSLRSRRQLELEQAYGFMCTCTRCAGAPETQLEEALVDFVPACGCKHSLLFATDNDYFCNGCRQEQPCPEADNFLLAAFQALRQLPDDLAGLLGVFSQLCPHLGEANWIRSLLTDLLVRRSQDDQLVAAVAIQQQLQAAAALLNLLDARCLSLRESTLARWQAVRASIDSLNASLSVDHIHLLRLTLPRFVSESGALEPASIDALLADLQNDVLRGESIFSQ